MKKINIQDVIEAIELSNDQTSSYLDKSTGEIFTLTEDDFIEDEDDTLDDYPDWQRDSIEKAKQIMENESNFIGLPSNYDFHEYSVMENFIMHEVDQKIADELLLAIKRSGAFRWFKDAIHRLGVAEEWYKFKNEALEELAVFWCEENDIPYEK